VTTHTVYLLKDRQGRYWACAKAAPAGAALADAGILVLGVRGAAPPALPGGPLPLRGLLEWAVGLGRNDYDLAQVEEPHYR